MERTRKNDSILQAHMDRREIATAALFLDSIGMKPRNKSDLVRIIFKHFVNTVTKKGFPFVETTHEADQVLTQLGITGLNVDNRLGKAHLENLQLEILEDEPEAHAELGTFSEPKRTKKDWENDMKKRAREALEATQERMK